MFKKEIIYKVKASKLKVPKKGEMYLFQFKGDVPREAVKCFRDYLKKAMKEKRGGFLVTSGDYKIVKLKKGQHKIEIISPKDKRK